MDSRKMKRSLDLNGPKIYFLRISSAFWIQYRTNEYMTNAARAHAIILPPKNLAEIKYPDDTAYRAAAIIKNLLFTVFMVI